MAKITLHVPPFADYCVDFVLANPDGSMTATNATQGACGVLPPPSSGFSPNALDRATLKYSSHTPAESVVNNAAVRVMDNVFGRINALQPVRGYPFVSGSTVQIPGIGTGKLWQSMFTMPPGLPDGAHHQFRGVNYGAGPPPSGTLTASPLPIDVRVYEVSAAGLFVPIDRIGAHKEAVHMDGTTLITFTQGEDANQYRVPLIGGHTYVIESKWHNLPDHGDMMFGWN